MHYECGLGSYTNLTATVETSQTTKSHSSNKDLSPSVQRSARAQQDRCQKQFRSNSAVQNAEAGIIVDHLFLEEWCSHPSEVALVCLAAHILVPVTFRNSKSFERVHRRQLTALMDCSKYNTEPTGKLNRHAVVYSIGNLSCKRKIRTLPTL